VERAGFPVPGVTVRLPPRPSGIHVRGTRAGLSGRGLVVRVYTYLYVWLVKSQTKEVWHAHIQLVLQRAQLLVFSVILLSWRGLEVYAFPPFSLLPRVLRKAEEVSPRMILLAPLGTSQPGFPDLTRLALVGPLTLALGPRALVQPRSGIPPGNPGVLCLTAWLLCMGL